VSGRSNAVYRVTVEIAPESEQAWVRWQTDEHIPAVVKQPGFLGATLWKDRERAADGWARYVIHYRSQGLAAIEAYRASPEAAHLRDDHTKKYGTVTRIIRSVLADPVFIGAER
jgi:antibiotic biosynthesis monooxygenase (ABM) superfamily enzyme